MSESASDSLPVVLVPGLTCTARLYADQIPALWQFGPVTVADHRRDDSMANVAQRILATAPPSFALAGLSMGGFIALEIATSTGAGRKVGATRYLIASRCAGADRTPPPPDGARQGRSLRGDSRTGFPHLRASQTTWR